MVPSPTSHGEMRGTVTGKVASEPTIPQPSDAIRTVTTTVERSNLSFPIVGIGGPRNIRDVRYVRGIDIGLTQTNILNSFRRSNERRTYRSERIRS